MDRSLKTFAIPNELCRRAGIAGTWLPINHLSVFPYEKRTIKQQDSPSNFASDSAASIFNLREVVVLFHPILRKLVNESNGTYLNLQSYISSRPGDHKSEILKISRQYRSIIRACLENLQEEIRKVNKDEKEELQNYVTIFYSVECIWHLCEILFIDVIPGNICLPHLLEWVRFHFPKHERNATTLLNGDLTNLDHHVNYWDTVFGSLLQGRVAVTRVLLKHHSNAGNNVFKLVDQVLKAMPILTVINSISINEFNMQWRHWTMDVQLKLDAKQFVTEPKLNLLMQLVVGEEQAWAQVQDSCETWYAFLAGWLFYTEPTVKTFELGQFAKHSINKMRLNNQLKHLDRVLLAAMEFDMFEVIKEIQYMTENGWFVAHLTDILYHAGKITALEKEVENFSSQKLRESFLLDYGTTLMGHKSLWEVGLSYLDHCPNDGLAAIELLLPRIPVDNENKALKLVRQATTRNLTQVAQEICKVQGMVSVKRGRIGNALVWALKSQDGPFASYLADKFLLGHIEKGQLDCTDLLDNLGLCMLASDRLIFLGKYYEFHSLCQSKKLKEAASLLISLLASKIVPKYFWSVLLTDAIPLLECEELVFSSNDTYTMLHCLEEKEDSTQLTDEGQHLRLAAGRYLARALIQEAQS